MDGSNGRSGSALQGGGANIFPSEFNNTAGSNNRNVKSAGDLFPADDFMPGADYAARAALSSGVGAGAAVGTTTTGAMAATTNARKPNTTSSSSRKGFEPLPIQSMTQDRLQAALRASKVRFCQRDIFLYMCSTLFLLIIQMRVVDNAESSKEHGGASHKKKTSGNHASAGHQNAAEGGRSGRYKGFDFNSDDEEDQEFGAGPEAILQLPEDGSSSPSPGAAQRGGKGSNRSNRAKGAHSPSASQSSSTSHLPPASPSSNNNNNRAGQSRGGRRSHKEDPSSNGGRKGGAEDVKLPMFKFDPLRTSEKGSSNETDGGNGGAAVGGEEGVTNEEANGAAEGNVPTTPSNNNNANPNGFSVKASAGNIPLSQKLNATVEVRTDVNDKATFLDPAPGKFRREFSNDHPLAKGGTGKYTKELKKGVTPTGLHMEVPDNLKSSSVADTISASNKIERLTYTAQRRVVDPKSQVDELKKRQSAALKLIVMEERDAEAIREQTLKSLADPQERMNLEGVSISDVGYSMYDYDSFIIKTFVMFLSQVFSEERRRASDRIIHATRQHEEVMKQLVLTMMDLGSGSGGGNNRLPAGNFFQ